MNTCTIGTVKIKAVDAASEVLAAESQARHHASHFIRCRKKATVAANKNTVAAEPALVQSGQRRWDVSEGDLCSDLAWLTLIAVNMSNSH
jgi:hypothetical protein